MLDPSTIYCPLSVFDVTLSIKRPVQNQFQFLQNRVQRVCHVKCLTYSVDVKVNHNLFIVCVSRNVYRFIGQY